MSLCEDDPNHRTSHTISGTSMIPSSTLLLRRASAVQLAPFRLQILHPIKHSGTTSYPEKYLPKLSNLHTDSTWKDVTALRSEWSSPLRDPTGHFEVWLVHSAPRSGRDRKNDSRFYSSDFPSTSSKTWKSGASVAFFSFTWNHSTCPATKEHFEKLTTILPNQIHIYSWEATTKIVWLQPPEILTTSNHPSTCINTPSPPTRRGNNQAPDNL